MMNSSVKILFMLILLMSTMITVSANSWLGAWMGLEINLLSFIPLMSDNNLMSTEASLKYFLIQALASTVFLFSVIFLMVNSFYLLSMNNFYLHTLILSALFMKSGAAPFHFWFPVVMQGLSWMNAIILMTWQKIAPFMLISYIIIKPMMLASAIFSSIIGAVGGLNQTSLFKLMAYSSINHLSWMLMAMMYSQSLWLMYFLFYSFLSMTLILMFYIFNISHINQLFNMNMKSKILKFMVFLNLLSLGGLPPFIGFMPKWMVIQLLTMNNQLFTMTVLIISALITLFFYLRICYTTFMFNYMETNWKINLQYNNLLLYFYWICSSFSIMGLFIISMMFMVL
uniref:NADH-ubiquinone oxidoreductase chain 2 n=1 Tax=Melanagromyza sojae TaxID=1838149 RepID=A0A3G1DKE3_MELSO|nr:NADH dehydrogenase subunit 2 [Melanagromyza sojae]ANA56780.1 NADH dehydrogenase subunit 2 [Melanagromyza sojae]